MPQNPIPVRQVRQDIIGKRFGRWVVLSFARSNGKGRSWWLCRCDCGTVREVQRSSLTEGKSPSCGCKSRDFLTTHGWTHTPEHIAWLAMKRRCSNKNVKCFKNYGGRGITVCERWLHSFEAFLEDMGPRPSSKHSIDRIDNDGDYEPGNCRWATVKQQARNKRSVRLFEYLGESRSISEWAELYGVNFNTLYTRMQRGLGIGEALMRPMQPGRKHIGEKRRP